MGRRKICRLVEGMPEATFFKPHGVPLHGLASVALPVEGLEALRLVDAQGLNQEEAATRMGVSRPTLCRILANARRLVAQALSSGQAIRIEGGDFTLHPDAPGSTCPLRLGPGGGCRQRMGRRGPKHGGKPPVDDSET